MAGAAVVAVKVRQLWYQPGLIILMVAPTAWRGLVLTVGGQVLEPKFVVEKSPRACIELQDRP